MSKIDIFARNLLFIILGTLGIVLGIIQPLPARAQNSNDNVNLETPEEITTINKDQYFKAIVVSIIEEGTKSLGGVYNQLFQKVKVELTTGEEKGQTKELTYGENFEIKEYQKLKAGEKVVVLKSQTGEVVEYYLVDKYRLPSAAVILAIFLALAIFLGRLKGLSAIVGLGLSIWLLVGFVMPRIMAGADPLLTSVIGAVVIAIISLYMAHGFSKRTGVALLSTIITLGLATGLATLFVSLAKLTGLGTEEAFYLQAGAINTINVRGLLLGAIIIGTLGILDDITTSQAAAIDELNKANPNLSYSQLYNHGISVGREHIASLVNTLALAYVGASFPLLLLFTTNTDQPLWLLLNSEVVMEEVIRTLVGSTALLLAVPITTFLATRMLRPREIRETNNP